MVAAARQQQSAAMGEMAVMVVLQRHVMSSSQLIHLAIGCQKVMITKVLQEITELTELQEHHPGRLIYRDVWHLMQPAVPVAQVAQVAQGAEDRLRHQTKTIW